MTLIYGTSIQALHFLTPLALIYTLLGFVDSDPPNRYALDEHDRFISQSPRWS
jgi:hypothetical protein